MCRAQEFEGIAVVEKKVILYGSEGCVSIYRSGITGDFCCNENNAASFSTNMPIATVEVAEPVVLGAKVVEPSRCNFTPCCVCACENIPDDVCACVGGSLCDSDERHLYVALGFFSIVRIERPAQYLVNVAEYCIPDKECVIGLFNFSGEAKTAWINERGVWVDLMTEHVMDAKAVTLPPYGFYLLKSLG